MAMSKKATLQLARGAPLGTAQYQPSQKAQEQSAGLSSNVV